MKLFLMILLCSAVTLAESEPFSIAAVGDSITAGFNAVKLGMNREYSWSAGDASDDKFESVYQKFQKKFKTVAINEAVSASTASDLAKQVRSLRNRRLDYATILIGANDLCKETVEDDNGLKAFENHVTEAIEDLLYYHPKIKIDMGAIPNLPYLYDMGIKAGCKAKWEKVVFFCPRIFKKSATVEDRNLLEERWLLANAVLKKVAGKYTPSVRYVRRMEDPAFSPEDMSSHDCFHPNRKGQSFIADVFWEFGWAENGAGF